MGIAVEGHRLGMDQCRPAVLPATLALHLGLCAVLVQQRLDLQ